MCRPTSRLSEVTSTERTTIASSSTPSATAIPNCVRNVNGRVPSTAKVDASTSPAEVISEQDQRVISQVVDAGRALVLAINKWDTLDEDRHYQLEKEVERELARVRWATRVNISAATGRGVNKLADHLRAALASWERRVPTAELNTFVRALVQETPPPARGGRAPKIKYVTQADIRPPRFVVFSTGFLEAGYRRFLERKLRENFDFEGTPIEISVKVREGRDRNTRG